MKDKLLKAGEVVLDVITKVAALVWFVYLFVLFMGLWGHLHNYALSAYK